MGVAMEGDDAAPVSAAISSATEQLARSLETLSNLAPQEQLKSPLELVRDATGVVTDALRHGGVVVPVRDVWAAEIHPADVYDLYPASSRELGDEAWELHLGWGIDKARIVAGMVPAPVEEEQPRTKTGPAVAVFGVDAEVRTGLADKLGQAGYRMLLWRNPAALAHATVDPPQLVLVDLQHPKAHDAIRAMKAAGIRVVAVTAQIDDLVMPGIMALGAEEVLELRRLASGLDRLLPRLA